MVEVKVNPGVCGLNTIIKVNSEDMQNAIVEIITEWMLILKYLKLRETSC